MKGYKTMFTLAKNETTAKDNFSVYTNGIKFIYIYSVLIGCSYSVKYIITI